MNTYNDNLRQTVNQTLADLNGEQEKLTSAQISAQYSLYYAQGAEITARNKLLETKSKVTFYSSLNDQGVINDNKVNNALASATQANTKVASAVTNVATAASNVQVASNAVALLASDIGAALNIGTASLFNTDIYNKIKSANDLINETANDIKAISFSSMEAAGDTSSIIAPTVVNNASATKTQIENVLKLTTAEFTKYNTLAGTENKDVGAASKAEHLAEGVFKDSNKALAAITKAYKNANKQLNLNLAICVQSAKGITLSFDAITQNPFSSPHAAANIPPMNPVYYLTLISSDKAALLTTDQAEQLFSQQTEQTTPKAPPGKITSAFTCVSPGSTTLGLSSSSVDVFGQKVQPGIEYVAFLYITVDLKYKQYLSNFNDLLSAASQRFTLATSLPEVTPVTPAPVSGVAKGSVVVTFTTKPVTLPNKPGESAPVQYRCIFVRSSLEPKRGFLTDEDKNSSPIYFDSQIAQQVAPSNYTIAIDAAAPPDVDPNCETDAVSSVPAASIGSTVTYTVTLEDDTTDNFGNPIIPGRQYKPYVLAVIDGDKSIASQFIPTLSNNFSDAVISVTTPETNDNSSNKETK